MHCYLWVLSILPLLPPLCILYKLLSENVETRGVFDDAAREVGAAMETKSSVGAQLLLFLALGILGHVGTDRLIPNIQRYMLKRGICGKDLGKKGTKNEHDDV